MQRLNIAYKGERNYLHGTDFYEAIFETITEAAGHGRIKKLCFKSFARCQCLLMINDRPKCSDRVVGNGTWLSANSEEIKFWIVESDELVTSRYPFDEAKLGAPCTIQGNLIQLKEVNEYSTIENIVALTKKLNYALTPDVKGKWVFGQIDLLKSLPEDFGEIEIERTKERKGMFSSNQIMIDGERIGEIKFIVGKP